MQAKIPFSKQFTPADKLVKLLQTRGLIINDSVNAERYIRNIGYYRLSAYMHPLLSFPKEKHCFKAIFYCTPYGCAGCEGALRPYNLLIISSASMQESNDTAHNFLPRSLTDAPT